MGTYLLCLLFRFIKGQNEIMDVEVAYKRQLPPQMPGGILIGDPHFKLLSLQMKIWGLGRSAVWLSVGSPFSEKDVAGLCVCVSGWRGGVGWEGNTKKNRKAGTTWGSKSISKEFNLSLCWMRWEKWFCGDHFSQAEGSVTSFISHCHRHWRELISSAAFHPAALRLELIMLEIRLGHSLIKNGLLA